MSIHYVTRPATAGDVSYIVSTWLHAADDAAPVRGMNPPEYRAALRNLAATLIQDPTTVAVVATPEGDDETLLGWSLARGSTLIFVYVRSTFRGIGIARALVPPDVDAYAFRTPEIKKVPLGWSYRPDAVWISTGDINS